MAVTDDFVSLATTGVLEGREVFEFLGGDLVEDDLQELVTLSLFTWRRALDDDLIPEGASRQGWFADPEFGSRLYLLGRAKATQQTLVDAKQYAEEALSWLVTDGILRSVSATAEFAPRGRGVYLTIDLRTPLGDEARARYSYLWST